MPISNQASQLFQGFSRLNREERFNRLLELGALTSEDVSYLRAGDT